MSLKTNFDKNTDISQYNYLLPEGKIALFPSDKREESMMIYLKGREIGICRFKNLIDFIQKEDVLFFNNSKVVKARLIFKKETGAPIEIFCLEPVLKAEEESLSTSQQCYCLIGNNKKWKSGKLQLKKNIFEKDVILTVEKTGIHKEGYWVNFEWNNRELTFFEILEYFGKTPLPPYIQREEETSDRERYQTVYAQKDGSVAAPTAGLHFSEGILKELSEKGIAQYFVTLHVGAGTFKPVKSEKISKHEMHREDIIVEPALIHALSSLNGKKIIAVGTTTVRALESLYWYGVKRLRNLSDENHIEQWLPYDIEKDDLPTVSEVLEILKLELKKNTTLRFSTSLMIIPGYRFRFTKGLITNFHQPQSTLLLLVAAFIGPIWKQIYQTAIDNDMRFLSYGDACLFLPEE